MLFFGALVRRWWLIHDNLDKLGERLKSLRLERELTLDMVVYDLEQKYGVTVSKGNLSRWENGVNYPSLLNADYLCRYYGVSLDYLIGNTESRAPVDLLVMRARQGGKNEKQ